MTISLEKDVLVTEYRPRPIHIECRRWFSSRGGNTYFSAYVLFSDKSKQKIIDFEYGYGEHCLYKALKWLDDARYIEYPTKVDAMLFIRETLNCSFSIIDVSRKKDL